MTKLLRQFMSGSSDVIVGGPPSGDDRLADEQLRMVWAHSSVALLVAVAFAISLALALRGMAAPPRVVDAWLAAKMAISAYRALQGWRYLRKPSNASGWTRSTQIGLMIDAAMWGSAGLYVAMTAPLPLVSFVSAVLACISCVATFGLQVSARFTACYTVPILAPTAIGLVVGGQGLEQLGGLGLLLLLGLQLSTARRSERRLAESVQLRWRAEALAQEKEEALKTAMRQSAVKTQFLANISHELRTPLHGILGMAQLLRLTVGETGLAHRVELIENSGQHLLGLINDLLDISRIEAGQFVIRSERFDLVQQVEQLAGIYAMRAEGKALRFESRCTLSSPCWVTGDPARFRQVLHNLLGNAVKFTEQGAISLTVERDEVSGMVRTQVTDTGIGIPSEALSRIFEPFQQVDSGEAIPTTEGAGLGLAIARDIARAMGGDIVVAESEVGKGATLRFSAWLPSAKPAVADGHDSVHAAASITATISELPASAPVCDKPDRRPCMVLLVEDNDINALVASNFLEIIGVEMERVKDGEEAVLAALRAPRPDLVLMDCHMPRMDGYEATRQIRRQERLLSLAHLPIVALTATASDTERQGCLDAGMDDYLSKPCTLENLREAVQHWIAERAATSTNGSQQQEAQQDGHAVRDAQGALGQPQDAMNEMVLPAENRACPGAPCQA
jgi:signal transduction histidine kinase/DNA-binding NarL/FixJ family response regulator